MTYAQDEASIEDGDPVEVFEFVGNSTTYRYTSAEENVSFDSGAGTETFTSIPLRRSMVASDAIGGGPDMLVEVPVDTTLATEEVFQLGFRGLELTVWRVHRTTGFSSGIWKGIVTSWNVKDRMISLKIPNKYVERMQEEIPRLQYQSYCNNVLFDGLCQLGRYNFTEPSFLDAGSGISADGKTLTVTTLGLTFKYESDGWGTGGEIVHDATGARRMIIRHNNLTLLILRPFNSGVSNGDAVTVYAGCNHSLDHCVNKFLNPDNFNGMPFILSQSTVTTGGGNN